jgi:hypothetical protein
MTFFRVRQPLSIWRSSELVFFDTTLTTSRYASATRSRRTTDRKAGNDSDSGCANDWLLERLGHSADH